METIKKIHDMDKKWVCVEITHRYNKTQHVQTVKTFLSKVLKEDEQVLFLGDELDTQNFKNVMDGYFFIQSQNMDRYIDIFKQSKYINNVLIHYDSISYINGYEIQQMVDNYKAQIDGKQNTFVFGDVVKIKKGMLRDLYAMVTNVKSQHELQVVFKFVSGYRFEKMQVANCQRFDNFFNLVRSPVR